MKITMEIKIIKQMISLYCKKNHKRKTGLCEDCVKLSSYAEQHLLKCPHKSKPFCSTCPIHCYKPDMREKMQEVMRFSGPRLLFKHPILALKHAVAMRKIKKKAIADNKINIDGKANIDYKPKLRKKITNGILIALGFLFLGIGIAGIIIPILPGFPFFFLTLICFAKGSEKFHKWFKSTKIYRKQLEPFLKTHSMTNSTKARILVLITILISLPIIFVDLLPMRIVLGVVILFHYVYFIFFVKSVSKTQLQEILKEIRKKESEKENIQTGTEIIEENTSPIAKLKIIETNDAQMPSTESEITNTTQKEKKSDDR